MRFRFRLLSLIVIVAVLSCGCGSSISSRWQSLLNTEDYSFDALFVPSSLAAALDTYPLAALGSVKAIEYDRVRHLYLVTFTVAECFQGDAGTEIQLESGIETDWAVGRETILFARRYESVFQENSFYAPAYVIYEKNNILYSEGITDIENYSMQQIILAARDYCSSRGFPGSTEVVGEYIHSQDIYEIANASDHVFSAVVTEIINNSVADRTSYRIDVTDNVKGEAVYNWIIVPKNSCSVGESYLFMLNEVDEKTVFYVASSPCSVLSAESEEARSIIRQFPH